jgi:diguanylate cyclase (GGDEF)-like protein
MANCRKGDFVCRYGGEEFVVVMPGASLKIAIRRAEAWRRGVEELTTPGERGDIHITISLGVAAFPEAGKDPSALLQAVDDALYQAKSAGRNCVRPAG